MVWCEWGARGLISYKFFFSIGFFLQLFRRIWIWLRWTSSIQQWNRARLMCCWHGIIHFVLLRRLLKQTISENGQHIRNIVKQFKFGVVSGHWQESICKSIFTWRVEQINHVDTVMWGLHTNMDRRMNWVDRRKRAVFWIWPRRLAAGRLKRSNQRMRSAPNMRNWWILTEPFSWPLSFHPLILAIPHAVSLCPMRNTCEHNKWQLYRMPVHL